MQNKRDIGDSSLSAKQKWEAIPPELREKLIRNVWCSHCRDVCQIVDYRVYPSGSDIILRGLCDVCHGKVARVVERR